MKNNINATFKRLCATLIALTLMLSINSTYAFASNTQMDSDVDVSQLPYGTSVTYNVETHDILYGMDQSEDYAADSQNAISSEERLMISKAGTNNFVQVPNTLDSPYRNICYVKASYSDGTVISGSGTLVYFNVLLTAGHIVYDKDHGGWATSVRVYPARTMFTEPLGFADSTSITSNLAWTNNQDREWDWAIVDLNKSFSTWQLFGYYNDYTSTAGTEVTEITYSGWEQVYRGTKFIAMSERLAYIEGTLTNGNSGGAVIDKNSGVLVGILTANVTFENNAYEKCTACVNISQDLFNRIAKHQQEVSGK